MKDQPTEFQVIQEDLAGAIAVLDIISLALRVPKEMVEKAKVSKINLVRKSQDRPPHPLTETLREGSDDPDEYAIPGLSEGGDEPQTD